MTRRLFLTSAAGLAAMGLLGIPMAWAQSLDAAKAAGLLGERSDGLVGVIRSDAGAQALADQVNAKRMAEYRAIAQRNGTGVDAVQAIAGRKLISDAAPGSYVLDATGTWKKK